MLCNNIIRLKVINFMKVIKQVINFRLVHFLTTTFVLFLTILTSRFVDEMHCKMAKKRIFIQILHDVRFIQILEMYVLKLIKQNLYFKLYTTTMELFQLLLLLLYDISANLITSSELSVSTLEWHVSKSWSLILSNFLYLGALIVAWKWICCWYSSKKANFV
jgi:hypothetical protein